MENNITMEQTQTNNMRLERSIEFLRTQFGMSLVDATKQAEDSFESRRKSWIEQVIDPLAKKHGTSREAVISLLFFDNSVDGPYTKDAYWTEGNDLAAVTMIKAGLKPYDSFGTQTSEEAISESLKDKLRLTVIEHFKTKACMSADELMENFENIQSQSLEGFYFHFQAVNDPSLGNVMHVSACPLVKDADDKIVLVSTNNWFKLRQISLVDLVSKKDISFNDRYENDDWFSGMLTTTADALVKAGICNFDDLNDGLESGFVGNETGTVKLTNAEYEDIIEWVNQQKVSLKP